MKPPRTERERIIAEQCWVGIACLLFWAVIVMGLFRSCSGATLQWNPNPEADVTGYKVYQLGSPNVLLASTSATTAEVTVSAGDVVAVSAVSPSGESALSAPVTVPMTSPELPRADWKLKVSSQETVGENAPASNAIDDRNATIWHTGWDSLPPHYFAIELPRPAVLSFLRYQPRQDGLNGTVTGYEVEISDDGVTWEKIASGTWAKTSAEKQLNLGLRSARFLRLWGADAYMAAAEIYLHGVYEPEAPAAAGSLVLTVQQSAELTAWSALPDVLPISVPIADAKKFFRLKIETPQP